MLMLLYVVLISPPIGTTNRYDLLINEIMEDPTLSGDQTLGLPEAEYIELYNRSETAIELDQYTLSIGTKKLTFPPYLLPPESYLILTKSGNELLEAYGNTLFFPNFPNLPSAQTIVVKDIFDETIDALSYDQEWYQSNSKASGAYALERINPLAPCIGKSNWMASTALIGGTPGKENANLVEAVDTTFPRIINSYPISENQVRLTFDKAMQETTILNVDNYQLLDNTIVVANSNKIDYSEVILTLAKDLSTTLQTLQLSRNIQDCIQNPIDDQLLSPIAFPQQANASDIVINEILFNPLVGGKDFVELHNTSDKVLDLSDLAMVNGQRNDGANKITAERLIFPNDFIVLTESPSDIIERYTVNIPLHVLTQNLPAFGDEAGNITLFNANTIIDQVDYLETFHSALLNTVEGVSLERISLDKASHDPSNWHSAAAIAGYATPTESNSQTISTSVVSSNTHFHFSTKTISPNGDGYADFLQIDYAFEQVGYIVSIAIYDAVGHLVQSIVQEDLAAINGGYQWDGSGIDGQKAPIGIYVVWIEYFNPNGDTRQLKEAVVVAGKL